MKPVVTVLKYIVVAGFAIIGGVAVAGAVRGAKDHLNGHKVYSVQQVLEEHCQCETVDQILYLKGIQYNSDDGLSTERAEFQLKNCTYANLSEEVQRINTLLKTKVPNYKAIDILKLEFIGAEKHETLTIKNGVVQ